MLYNPFNFQSNDNWDTDGLYWYNEFYTKKLVWTGLNQFHGLQKTIPRWSGSVPTISGLVLDWLQFMVAHFGGKKPDWTGLANTIVRACWSNRCEGCGEAVWLRDQQYFLCWRHRWHWLNIWWYSPKWSAPKLKYASFQVRMWVMSTGNCALIVAKIGTLADPVENQVQQINCKTTKCCVHNE